ncbi:MAG TPA: glycosyltransferase, partial [Candidatus Saccharimonadia bacterium]|nr:glycosyltransferase [Candidatus Saccharimonadia bacterium]
MADLPLVSIVVPTYNRARVIKKTLASALSQTYPRIEVIVVDDGSSDDTQAVLQSISDPRVHYFVKPNGGPSAARNFGVAKATGKWIMYLDSDDELLPECAATMMDWLTRHPRAVFAIPRGDRRLELYEHGKMVKFIDDSGDTPPQFTIRDIFMRNAGFSCNGLTHLRSLADEGLRWDENLASMEDWEFMMTIGERYPDGFLYVPAVLYKYRQRFGSDNLVSQRQYSSWADAFEYIYTKHQGDHMLEGQTWYP